MSKEPYPSETADRFIVRFPDGMRDRIKEAAAANNRSMNSEIIARLEASFHKPEFGGLFGLGSAMQAEPSPAVEKLLKEIETLNSRLAIIEALAGEKGG